MTTLIAQGQRIAKLEQHLEDHLDSCEAGQAATLLAIQTLTLEVRAVKDNSMSAQSAKGLTEQIATLKSNLDELVALRNKGMGALAAVTAVMSIFGALIIMGIVAFFKDITK